VFLFLRDFLQIRFVFEKIVVYLPQLLQTTKIFAYDIDA